MIPLDYYRMFYYVAQYKSFTRAAEYLNNSQPNLTRCMNILENELGCPLFIRSNRGVTLTPEGDKLYHYVSVGYEQILTGEQKIRKTKDMEEGMITIGVSDIALHLILLDRLEEFHETYPSIRLQILSDSAPRRHRLSPQSSGGFLCGNDPHKHKKAPDQNLTPYLS